MLSAHFLNLCFTISLQKNKKIDDNVIKNMFETLLFYKEKEKEIPLQSKQKFTLVFNSVRLRYEGLEIDEVLDKLTSNKAFIEYESYIKSAEEHVLSDDKINIAIKRIQDRKRLVFILKDIPHLEKVINQFNTSSYEDVQDFVESFERIISNAHNRISENNRKISVAKISQLDLSSDNYEPVIEQIQQSYSGKNSISTGYSQLDGFLNGGFEPNRIYIFGGSSGDGKSTLLLNFIRNAVERKKTQEEKIGPRDIYVYVTLENLIDESLVRLYSSLTNKKISDIVKNFSSEKLNIEKVIKEWQDNNNSIIDMSYFPPTVTSVSDILVHVNEIERRYKTKGQIKAIYVDYLDLLMAGQKFDLYRLEMGQVVLDLKVLSIKKNAPCISVTQLNRSGYDHKEGLSLVQMSESIKKVDHSDFVGLLRVQTATEEIQDINTNPSGNDILTILIGKNRCGPKNKVVTLKANFASFRIDDNYVNTSIPFLLNSNDISYTDELSI